MKAFNMFSNSVLPNSSATPGTVPCQAPRNSPGKNIGTCCHFFLQGIFLTQGLTMNISYIYLQLFIIYKYSPSQASTVL